MESELSVLVNESTNYSERSALVNTKAVPSLGFVESANKLIDLDRLLSTMIHQIRNQCMTIKGYTSMLNYEDGMSDKGFKWLSKITRGVGSLEYFLKDFEKYRISKIQKKEFLKVNLKVKQVWSNLIDICNIDADKIHVNINIEQDEVIFADRNNFIKMLYHVMKNAVESIENTGIIEINFKKEKLESEKPDKWIFEVKDTGRGMTDIEKRKAGEILFSSKEFHIGCGLNLVAAVSIQLGAKLEIST
ncbi:HAMP domain-containing histidine kinase, partial [bacterium]|nr:HAMP domain-containing histidine kinase [bacterium]